MDGLAARTTCALCTGHGDEVRATPIEYLLVEDRLYLLSEGGEKFAHLLANPRVSVAVYDPFVSMSSLFGLQLTGRAALVPGLVGRVPERPLPRRGSRPSGCGPCRS